MDATVVYERFEAAQIAHTRTIRTFARNCVNQLPGWDVEDIEQELLVVLWRCAANYDPNKGASFSTLFQGSARNKVISLIRHVNTKGRKTNLVYLEQEDIAAAVNAMYTEGSAEDWYLAIAMYGEKLLSEMSKSEAA